jgi:isoaspartyl peptidase/L-asparaginase-like protein (Ntn-hydrolase superfamily)
MTTRREFLKGTGAGLAALGAAGALGAGRALAQAGSDPVRPGTGAMSSLPLIDRVVPPRDAVGRRPLVVSTWRHGLPANDAAWKVLAGGGRALDAVEAGVRVSEADPEVMSVGYGGRPDREGHVTLDACVMDERGEAGAVAFLQGILHPVSVARKVMELTPHVMLVGEGARRFAAAQGFPEQDLLTDKARAEWQEWQKKAEYSPWTPPTDPGSTSSARPPRQGDNHDTISMLALDEAGNLSGACTTSGLAYKMHGRVGDSPIIGASLFVDNEVGAACATGVGEEVMKTLGSFLIVELMRRGATPQEACEEGIARILHRHRNGDLSQVQVGYLAIDRAGNVGAYDVQPWFQYAITDAQEGTRLVDAASYLKKG